MSYFDGTGNKLGVLQEGSSENSLDGIIGEQNPLATNTLNTGMVRNDDLYLSNGPPSLNPLSGCEENVFGSQIGMLSFNCLSI